MTTETRDAMQAAQATFTATQATRKAARTGSAAEYQMATDAHQRACVILHEIYNAWKAEVYTA